MEVANYYITTLTTVFSKLLPLFIFLVGGYFVFVRLPFLFLKKSMDTQKKKLEEEKQVLSVSEARKDYTVEDYKEFQRKIKLMKNEMPKLEALNHTSEKKKSDGPKTEQKTEQKKDKPAPRTPLKAPSPEEVFGFKSNEPISKSELKKRYFELLKQNHPDRVASMGQDFKKLAEKNTKDINWAYEKLKNKAA